MSLNKAIAKALDNIFHDDPTLSSFTRLGAKGPDLRRYFKETDHFQCEIVFYRDKWWSKDGGTLSIELYCLVPAVQSALSGKSQSLANPDYSVPFHHFQYGLIESNPECSWQLHSIDDVTELETQMSEWLRTRALPWLEQFSSIPSVVDFMERKGRTLDLALLHSAFGAQAKAKAYVSAWITTLPRKIEKPLEKLFREGLLSAADQAALARASLQKEDHYRELVNNWLDNAGSFAPGNDGLEAVLANPDQP